MVWRLYLARGFRRAAGLHIGAPTSMRDSVMFTAMISGYINRVTYQEVLEMVRRMVSSGVEFDEFTYPSIITL